MTCQRAESAAGAQPARSTVADVFRAHGQTYRQGHALSAQQRKVMRAIEQCRTAALGGHVYTCKEPDCGYVKPMHNSCRNRHCPTCQNLSQAIWIEQRIRRILPVHHFHVVFTLPSELRPLVRYNRRLLFGALFTAAAQTLLELGDDPKRLGGRLGITAVLHTWTRKLLFHPHLHCLVTGGGLSPDGQQFIAVGQKYLFPVKVLSALFRGKFLAILRQLYDDNKLVLRGPNAPLTEPQAFGKLLNQLYQHSWVVYAKKPFGGPEKVYRYLGRYTHKVAISNQRILWVSDSHVRFLTKDGDRCTLTHDQFIARFLDHVLPKGFTKIRHFGLHASANVHSKLQQAKAALAKAGAAAPDLKTSSEDLPWNERVKQLTGVDPTVCPRCGRRLVARTLPKPTASSRSAAASPPQPWDTS